MQVEPLKPTLKAPGAMPLTLHYDESLSSFAFKVSLSRYNSVEQGMSMNDTEQLRAALDAMCMLVRFKV